MTINIMNQYIELTKKQINIYMRAVFENQFNKKYCDAFTQKYINIRYYNFYENEINTNMRKKILEHLKQTQEDIIVNNIKDRELIEKMCVFYYYILYFDNVVYYKDLKKTIEKLSKLRKKILNKYSENFEENLYNNIKEYITKKEELLKRFESEEFFLKFSNYPEKTKVYRVNLKYNIKFPPLYSDFAIEKAFNIGIINEDKLVVEYYLIVVQAIKDILKQNFKKQYIVEFAPTILKKSKKIKSLLNLINNTAVQEKISMKIRYENFLENKEKIYELMRNGYKFAIILDNSFKVNYKNIEDLNMFKYIIINKNLKHYKEIQEFKNSLNNVIEI